MPVKSRLSQIQQNQVFLVYFTKVSILFHDLIIYLKFKSLSKNHETSVQEGVFFSHPYITQYG